MAYHCNNCNKTFDHKNDYTRHVNRKKPCTQVTTTYQCDLCGQTFNQKGHYTRHTRRITPCVPHEQAMVYYREQLFAALRKIEDDKLIIKEKDEVIEELRNKPNIINNNIVGTNNGTVNIINIHSFGNENTEYITDRDNNSDLKRGVNGLQQLVHKKYLSPNHPENHNVVITNLRSNTCKVATNRGIKTQLRDDVTDLMYRNTNFDLEEYEGNQEIDRPYDSEIDVALYDSNDTGFTDEPVIKKTGKKFTRLKKQTELKIYNQKDDREHLLGLSN